MKPKTFKEIRDFCLTDKKYREYYDAPEESNCTPEQWKHYYADRGDGHSYRGTVLFGQSEERLEQLLGHKPRQILLTVDIRTFGVLHSKPYNGLGLEIRANIDGDGVQVEFSEPFSGPFHHEYRRFAPVSDHPFTEEGVIAEVREYCEKHILLPPGRYRDIQIERRWPKNLFIPCYKELKEALAFENERRQREMVMRYARGRFITEEAAYRLLDGEGVFDDLNCDEDQRLRVADQYSRAYNRDITHAALGRQRDN